LDRAGLEAERPQDADVAAARTDGADHHHAKAGDPDQQAERQEALHWARVAASPRMTGLATGCRPLRRSLEVAVGLDAARPDRLTT
jgi:hypothetical protein